MREGDFVFRSDLLPDNDFSNIVEVVPVFIECVSMSLYKGSNFGPPGMAGGEECIFVEQITGITVGLIGKKCATESIEISHYGKQK
jgi:hypothetical protein